MWQADREIIGMRWLSDRGVGRLTSVIIYGLALTTGCFPAMAQDRETWRCNAPNAHYDEYVIPNSGKATSITGRILFHSGAFGSDWAPLAKITFKQSNPIDGNCHCSGIAAYGFQNPDHVEYDVKTADVDTAIRASFFETAITFKISLDPQGAMTVTVGKNNPSVKSVPLRFPGHDSVVLSCSGADVSFLNIAVE
jgi:hypothetical protein